MDTLQKGFLKPDKGAFRDEAFLDLRREGLIVVGWHLVCKGLPSVCIIENWMGRGQLTRESWDGKPLTSCYYYYRINKK